MTHTEALTRAGVPDAAAADILALVDGGLSLGVAVWQLLPGQRGQTDYHALPGWPQCHCSRPATREDALPLCDHCLLAQNVCAHCNPDKAEVVSDSCGRTYARMRKPHPCHKDFARAVVRCRHRYAPQWQPAEYYASLEEAQQAAAFLQDEYRRHWPNAAGPQWQAVEVSHEPSL